jgi:hypothetical protein
METIYCEQANGRIEYWTYIEGERCFVSASWAKAQVNRGLARIVKA